MSQAMKRRGGFTLIEVVLVTAIFGMVLMVAYQILELTLRADERVTRNTRSGKIGQAILTIISRDLQGAVYRGLGPEVFQGLDGGELEDAEDSMHFITTAPVPEPMDDNEWTGELASVGYVLAQGPDAGKVLFRRVKWNIQDQPLEEGSYTPIYERVRGFSLRFLDEENEWQDAWNAEERMPEPTVEGDEPDEDSQDEDNGESEEEEEPLILPRAVEIVLYLYLGDEKGLVKDDKGDPITERYSTVVPILVSETLDLDTEDFGLLEEPEGG